MKRAHLADLSAFATVAQELSFTRAAASLGMTQSSLSHAIRRLEARLGLRLLNRTTRSVATTDAGQRLLHTLGPAFEHIDAEIESLTALREKPAGSIRVTTAEHAADTVLLPALERLLPEYPDIHVEVTPDYGLTDVVAERFDAGIRLGEQVAKDMVAVRIGADFRTAAVATPGHFASRRVPKSPRELHEHRCINVRLRAAKAGLGSALVPEDVVQRDVDAGRLVCVLADWCAPFRGYYLYYPSRRQPAAAFAIFVEALRYRPGTPPASRARIR